MSNRENCFNEELKVKVSALREYLTNKANNVILGITYWREHRHHKCYKCRKYGHIAKDCDNVCPLCDNIHPKVICVQTYYKTLRKIAKILNGVSELNIRKKMEQILTLEIVNEQQMVDIKYKYEDLEPQKQIEFNISKTKKVYNDLAPSMTTSHEIKHVFKNLKPIINKRVYIDRTTSIFDIFKTKEKNSKMIITQGRHIEFLMQSKIQIKNNRYIKMKKNKTSRMFIDMPYVYKDKNTVILREKRELTCQSALIRQQKLDHIKELAKHLRKQRNKARNELNKYNPSMFNKVKAEIERKWKEVEFIKKGVKKEKLKAMQLKDKQQGIIDRKIEKLNKVHEYKMQDIYDWQERLRQKQEKLDFKFEQANYLYRQANKIVKKNKEQILREMHEEEDDYDTRIGHIEYTPDGHSITVKNKVDYDRYNAKQAKLDEQEAELDYMYNTANGNDSEDYQEYEEEENPCDADKFAE